MFFYFFSISSLNVLFYLFILSNLILIVLIAIYNPLLDFFFQFFPSTFYFVSYFGPHFLSFSSYLIPNYFLSIIFFTIFSPHCFDFWFFMIGDCASLFYYVCFLWGNLDLMTQSLSFEDPRLSLVFFKSFLKIDFFYFHHSTLSYWALNFMICSVFFFLQGYPYFISRVMG
jgi:hypothetical protein